jgi:two-component system phosphate regulon sensor histidine kinase PhoR
MLDATRIAGFSERRLKYVLAAFFLALAIPAFVLIRQAYGQLRWQAFRQTQLLAEDLASRIDGDLSTAVAAEDARAFTDYGFLVVEGDPAANFVQLSPLSGFPVASAVPGVLGYFQVDADGVLTTPLLPPSNVDAQDYGISPDQLAAREALQARIRDALARNHLVPRAQDDAVRAEPAPAPEAFDQLTAAAPAAAGVVAESAESAATDASTAPRAQLARRAGPFERVDKLKLRTPFEDEAERNVVDAPRASADAVPRQKRTEQSAVPQARGASSSEQAAAAGGAREFRVGTFESEIDPFELGLLDSGDIVMFRKVWRDGQRYIQGALIDRGRFVEQAIARVFRRSSLASSSRLIVAYRGNVLSALPTATPGGGSAGGPAGALLYRTRMSPPLGDLELVFSLERLPEASGGALLGFTSVALAVVLCGGFLLMYRFAAGQIRLARQQQDFVSAVSHELRTPLTSIRMYGEMLKAGWADERKKQTYYEYIYDESERLSRLIENVLQLARMSRSVPELDLKRVSVAELMDIVRSKVAAQAERAGFRVELSSQQQADAAEMFVDTDCFTQIFINLVDNAIKFGAAAPKKLIRIECARAGDRVSFAVRDFGPGIPKSQLKKIFRLFYRPDNALSKDTVGTGIGLALVRQLTAAMGGDVDARATEPGAEFIVSFPAA